MRFNSVRLGPVGLLISAYAAATTAYPNSSIPINDRTAAEVVAQLNLIPNDEKGYYVQTFEDPETVIRTAANGTQSTRSASTEIFYLLEGSVGDSYWHRVDAVEVWHYYAGAPLTLSLSENDGTPPTKKLLGPDVFDSQTPQVAIPKGTWQSALSHGSWTLVGTTVAPGFVPGGVELAPPDWKPNGA
ncbi:RmlC-like cupin domain-containing protein [Annulohypoxylon maeteangense]|uniref:RmlC-like cupin domain-containing protein n=1 Tax=Annulohypoxylon maeteangense TaxID=1927788 RepID=UPI002007F504|nr:RmlC-like cupin domain-containing protein [Annulohypoxylon maeteangense]KAI0887563.1 RmlC-like cupin domain-containing protein [Annulohypoxylon maeteangense]